MTCNLSINPFYYFLLQNFHNEYYIYGYKHILLFNGYKTALYKPNSKSVNDDFVCLLRQLLFLPFLLRWQLFIRATGEIWQYDASHFSSFEMTPILAFFLALGTDLFFTLIEVGLPTFPPVVAACTDFEVVMTLSPDKLFYLQPNIL